jgi:hypothetical protein
MKIINKIITNYIIKNQVLLYERVGVFVVTWLFFTFASFIMSSLIWVLLDFSNINNIELFFLDNLGACLFPLVICSGVYILKFYKPIFSLFIRTAHLLLPKKLERLRILIDNKKGSLVIRKNVAVKTYNWVEEDVKFDSLNNWISQFGKSRAFLNLVNNMCDVIDRTKIFDNSLLIWAKNIPLMQVSEDTRIELLKMNKFVFKYTKVGYPSNIEHIFSNYTEKQIRTLFCSSYSGELYLDAIMIYCTKSIDVPKLPIFSKMRNLIYFMSSGEDNTFPESVLNLDLVKNELGPIEYIKDRATLSKYAQMFSNCAKDYESYCSRGKRFFYIIHSQNKIMFDVLESGRLASCYHKANSKLSTSDKKKIDLIITKAIHNP